MKKNISVNLFGVIYPIDEDAYQLLDCYLSNIRSYFSRQEDGAEIADDIEARVGELMSELSDGGQKPVTVEMVRTIVERIGEPEILCDRDL